MYHLIFINNYLYDVKNHPDTYIPTLEINSIKGSGLGVGVESEKPNLLTGRYKIEYTWDMVSDPSEATLGAINVENRGISTVDIEDVLQGITVYIGNKTYINYDYSGRAQKWYITANGVVVDDEVNVHEPLGFSPDGYYYATRKRNDETGLYDSLDIYE